MPLPQPAISFCQAVLLDHKVYIGVHLRGKVRAVLEGPPRFSDLKHQWTLCILDPKTRIKTITRFPLNTHYELVAKRACRRILPILLVGQKKTLC